MPLPAKTLRVLPNPWTYIDHKGRPAGRFFYEPIGGVVPDGRSIGSRIASVEEVQAARTQRVAGVTFQLQPADHDIQIAYDDEPVEVPNTDYYRKAISDGDLIAADRETAVRCGIASEKFEDYSKHIAAKREAAIKQFDAENGVGAFKYFEAERAKSAPRHEAPVSATSTQDPRHAALAGLNNDDALQYVEPVAARNVELAAIKKGDK